MDPRRLFLIPIVYLLNEYLRYIRLWGLVATSEQILEIIVLIWDIFTSRWVHFYERQERLVQEHQRVGISSYKKLFFILFLYICLFLLLLLEII